MNALVSPASRITLYALIVALLVWGGYLASIENHAMTANYLYNVGYSLLYVWGGLIGFFAWRSLGNQGVVAKGFLYLALSFVAYAIGLWMWTYYNLTGIEAPYPSWADLFFVLFIPFTALAITKFLAIYQILVTRRVVIESVIVFLIATTAILFYQGSESFFGDIGILEKAFNIMYLLTDSILITAAAVVIRTSGGTLHNNLILLVVGYLVRALADLVFYYRAAQEIYWNGDVSDVLYAVSAFLMVFATLRLTRELTTTIPAPQPQATGI